MNDQDADHLEEVDPPEWALAAAGLPLAEMEEIRIADGHRIHRMKMEGYFE